MIFSAFGNVPKVFTRLAVSLDSYAHASGERVIVQSGYTDFPFQYAESYPFLAQDELFQLMRDADLLILQGGWGMISEAISLGKKIIAVPRRTPEEHNHDQGELVKKLDSLGCLLAVYDVDTLPAVIEYAKSYSFKPLNRGKSLPLILQSLEKWNL